MVLHPKQKIIAKDRHRFRVLRCGRRFGKTLLEAQEIKGFLAKPSRVAYVANNYQQARDIMWELLKKELGGAILETNEARLEIKARTISGGETYIVLRGWESIENLRGQAFDFLILDEVAQMRNFWVNWQEVLRPTLTDRKGQAMFSSTPQGFNHFYDLCNLELTDSDFKTFHFTSYDNPYLPKDEIDKARETLPREVFEQEYLASFQKTQGLVFKEFSRERHLYETLPELYPEITGKRYNRYGGIDFGYRNPAAVLEAYFDGENLYIENEWYKRERTDIQIADYAASMKFEAVYPDPENAGAIEELRRKSVNVREVAKGKNSVKSGIQTMREMFIRGSLRINKRCINLISELETYSYDDERGDRNEEENPIKANDHAIDACRYLVMSLMPLVSRNEFLNSFPAPFNKKQENPAV